MKKWVFLICCCPSVVQGSSIFNPGSGGGAGDNFGSHVATQAVNMASFGISNIGTSSAVFNTDGTLTISSITANNRIDIGLPGTVLGLFRVGRNGLINRAVVIIGTGTTGLVEMDKSNLNRSPVVGSVLTIDSEDTTSSSYATYERSALAGGGGIIMATRSDLRVGIATNVINANLQVDSSAAGNKGVVVQGFSGQTGNLQEWQDNSGSILAFVDKSGSVGVSTNAIGTNIFQVGSSTTMAFTNNGHFEFHATTNPALSTCGTGFSMSNNSTDVTGTFTMGTLTISCTLTFASAWKNTPNCFANDETGVNAVKVVPTVNNIIFTTAGSGGDTVDYFCVGEQ